MRQLRAIYMTLTLTALLAGSASGQSSTITYGSGTPSVTVTTGDSSTSVFHVFNSANTELLRVQSDGKVGIGTTPSPLTLLHLYQPGAAVEMLWLDNPSAGSNKMSFHSGVYENAYIDSQYDGTNGWSLRFGTRNGGNSAADRMIISSGGNVGIGTTSPLAALHLIQSAAAEMLRLDNPSAGSNKISFHSDVYENAYINSQYDATNGWALHFGTRNGGNSAADRVIISSGGNVTVSGSVTATTIYANYQDVAEWVPAGGTLEAGMVVVLNRAKANEVAPSTKAYDTAVAGVVTDQPGLLLGTPAEGRAKIATTGRVKVRVDARTHPVNIGDLLVTSEVPGTAMVSEPLDLGGTKIHRPGTLIGKALEPLPSGEGAILVLLSLQ